MKLLFFDMEFADGKVTGSVYSFGYLVTDGEFRTVVPPTDLLINPESSWNAYVEQNILGYPKEEVEAAPAFPAYADEIRTLFAEADYAVGFAIGNDNRALRADCERYGIEPFRYKFFDVERLCRMMEEHPDAHGLGGYVEAWCGETPDHRHRSDGDAVATMHLLRAICRAKHVTPEMIVTAYPECCGDTAQPVRRGKKIPGKAGGRRGRSRARQKGKNHVSAPSDVSL